MTNLEREENNELEDNEKEASVPAMKIVFVTLGIVVLLFVLITGSIIFYIYTALQPIDPQSDEDVIIDIPMGSSVKQISSMLKEERLIKDERISLLLCSLKRNDKFASGAI